MSFIFTTNARKTTKQFRDSVERFERETNADFDQALRFGAALSVAAAQRVTPPYDRFRPRGRITRTKSRKDKLVGEGAISRDIDRTHKPAGAPGLPRGHETVAVFSRRHHESFRDKRGRVRRGARAVAVLVPSTIQQEKEKRFDRVGFAASGWKKAAEALGVHIAAWVKRHDAPGSYKESLVGKNKVIKIGNHVSWISNTEGGHRIARIAIDAGRKGLDSFLRRLKRAERRRRGQGIRRFAAFR